MNEENLNMLDELTLFINMDLNILYNALKYPEKEDLDIVAVGFFVKNIYEKSLEIRRLF